MITFAECQDYIDEVAFDGDLSPGDIQAVAERIAPGNTQVLELFQDLHQTYFPDEQVLEYYAQRLLRILS